LAGIDLVTGESSGLLKKTVIEVPEFVDFLKMLDDRYDPELRIQIVLDNLFCPYIQRSKSLFRNRP
jgi:hypothetical protein